MLNFFTISFKVIQTLSLIVKSALRHFLKKPYRYRPVNIEEIKNSDISIILGNGPSLSDDLPTLLNSDTSSLDIWCVNNFIASSNFLLIKPQHYMLADPGIWQINKLQVSNVELSDNLIHAFNNLVTWEMFLHLPYAAFDTPFTNAITSKNIKIRYFNNFNATSNFPSINRRIYDLGLGMPVCQNVLIPAITLSIMAKYKKIILLGADHSWHEEIVMSNGEMQLTQKHFYDKKASPITVFKATNTPITIADLFLSFGITFRSYEALGLYASQKNINIINSSSNSYIDAFKRGSLLDNIELSDQQ